MKNINKSHYRFYDSQKRSKMSKFLTIINLSAIRLEWDLRGIILAIPPPLSLLLKNKTWFFQKPSSA